MIYVAAAISFFTGLSNNEIAGLQWDDIKSIKYQKTYHYIAVYKVRNPGKLDAEPLSITHKEKYRRVPIVNELEIILDQYRKYIEREIGKTRQNDYIICDIEKTKNDANHEIVPCRVSDISQAKDDVERKVHKEPLRLGIKKKGSGSSETDYEDIEYYGDRYRINFEYRMLQTCSMSLGEVNYILGRQQVDTYSKHYCDFTNGMVLMEMTEELERWASRFRQGDALALKKREFTTMQTLNNLSKPERLDVEIDFEQYTGYSPLKVDISDRKGADVKLIKWEK